MKEKIIAFFVTLIFKIYALTFRYEVSYEDPDDKEIIDNDLKENGTHPNNHIYALLHQQEICLIDFFSGSGMVGLVSNSKDGEIIANIAINHGYRVVRGSSHKRAVAGLLACIKKLKQGYKISIAVDGPRGPIYKAKEGALFMSEKSQRPIVPISGNPTRYFCSEKSWNKILIPKPFSTIKIKFGKVKFYTKDELEQCLNRLRDYRHPLHG